MRSVSGKALLATAGVFAVVASLTPTHAQNEADALAQGFRNPPDSAKPRTWWHWTGGNVTREGITKDLEWMKRVGIAGFQLADVSAGGGQTVERPIGFGSPEWYDAVRHASAEAERRGSRCRSSARRAGARPADPGSRPSRA